MYCLANFFLPLSRLIFLAFCLCLLSFTVNAQSKVTTFQSLKEENGLSNNKVYDILHDSQGYIWFGTKDGLNLYDGYKFTVFKNDPEDSTSISSNYIQTLFEDSHGQLWIGTYDGGLNLYDRNTRTFTSFKHTPNLPQSISSNNVYSIYEDKSQNLWIGTYGGGLCKFNPDQQNFTVFKQNWDDKNSLSSNAVFDIHEDRNGQLWLATFGGGLCIFDPVYQTFSAYTHTATNNFTIPSNDLFAVAEDNKGNIWVGTYGAGLARFDRNTKKFESYQKDPSEGSSRCNYILAIEPDAINNLWIATRDEGIFYFDTKKETFYHFDLGLAHENLVAVNSLHIDNSGLLWVATEGEGAYKTYSPSIAFDHLISDGMHIPNFSAKSITSIYEDHQKNLWIGTFGDGVYRFDSSFQRVTNYTRDFFDENGIAGNFITSITEDTEGNIWIGTSSSGLSRFKPALNQWQTFQYEADKKYGLSSNAINILYVDKKGNLWVGTYGSGISRYDSRDSTFINIDKKLSHSEKSLSTSTVTTILEDDQFLWIGTKESGLYKVDIKAGTCINYTHQEANENSIPSNEITGIAKDANGFLWIGTFDKGICRLDEKTDSVYVLSYDDGLASDNICGILSGNDSTIWISTVEGISKLEPSSLRFSNFNKSNSLFSEEFVQWSCFKSKSGKLFFGSLGNLVSFYPSMIKEADYQPPLYTTSFFLYDQLQNFAKPTFQINEIELEYDDNFFEFEYALLSYDNPEKNQYAYMMEGLDKDWKYVNNRRLASYTNLDAGVYLFKVKACDRRGIWKEVSNPITIVIHPAWYHTWWFRIFSLTLVISLSATYYFYKLNAVKKQNILLESLVTQRTSELVQRNEKIKAQTKKIEEKNAHLLEAQSIIEERNRELKVINEELEERVEQRTSELRKANDQLIKANEELDMFVYRSYHDIIGPVARIQGLCKVAALDVKDQTALSYIHMLDESCTKAKETLHKVLDIYNIKNYDLTPEQVDLKDIVIKIKDELTANLSEPFSLVKFQCFVNTHTKAETDAFLLEKILFTLVDNAYKYSEFEEDSYVSISISEKTDDTLVIAVEDNGIGILPQLHSKVFTMFFRGTTDKSGTGLGLYIAKEAAQKLGGTITYKQKPKVTSFDVIIPRYWTSSKSNILQPQNNSLTSK